MKSYIPLEKAAIFFSCEPLSKPGYYLGVCHGRLYLRAYSTCNEREPKITKWKLLATVGFEPGPSVY